MSDEQRDQPTQQAPDEAQAGGEGLESNPQPPTSDPQARLAELEQQLEQVNIQHAELTAQHSALGTQHSELTAQHSELSTQHLAALRRALLAEHAGQVVPELVTGASVEELEASVETARSAFVRAAEAARQQLQAQQVPAGNPVRLEPDLSALPPLAKIAQGLNRSG